MYTRIVNKLMPSSDAYFEGQGIGTKHKLPPISVRFSAHVHTKLQEMPDRQQFIREAVNRALQGGAAVQDGLSLEQLQSHVNAVLLTIPPRQRKDAAKLFDKLLKRVAESHL